MDNYYKIDNIEARLKADAVEAMERDPELKQTQQLLEKNGGDIPMKHMYYIGLYQLRKDLVRHALGHDPDLSDLRTFHDREEANFHTLNAWLGDDVYFKVERAKISPDLGPLNPEEFPKDEKIENLNL
jgi:hypothetical protein